MANTTNFNWETPDDTDLVKDGALAIRTLGSAIDTSLVDLKGGTTGQVLSKASGTDMDFSWTTAGGGGKLLQLVSATTTTSTTTTSSTFTDATGITATITPTSATSKILVLISVNAQAVNTGTAVEAAARVQRNGTNIWTSANYGLISMEAASASLSLIGNQSISYLDAPASTSALTYKLQVAENTAGGTLLISNGSTPSTITIMEIGA